jgi:hypothetical protein
VANPTKMIPVILGRLFLAMANVNVKRRTGIMKIRFGNLNVKFNIFHTFQQPSDKAECLFLDSIEDLVAEPPPCILITPQILRYKILYLNIEFKT